MDDKLAQRSGQVAPRECVRYEGRSYKTPADCRGFLALLCPVCSHPNAGHRRISNDGRRPIRKCILIFIINKYIYDINLKVYKIKPKLDLNLRPTLAVLSVVRFATVGTGTVEAPGVVITGVAAGVNISIAFVQI